MKFRSTVLPTALLLIIAVGTSAVATPPKSAPKQGANNNPPRVHMVPGGQGYKGQRPPAMPELNLTEAQKTKIANIRKANQKAIQAIMADKSLSSDAKRKKMDAAMKQSKAKTDAVLTAEQKKKMAGWKAKQPKPSRPSANPAKPAKKTSKKSVKK